MHGEGNDAQVAYAASILYVEHLLCSYPTILDMDLVAAMHWKVPAAARETHAPREAFLIVWNSTMPNGWARPMATQVHGPMLLTLAQSAGTDISQLRSDLGGFPLSGSLPGPGKIAASSGSLVRTGRTL